MTATAAHTIHPTSPGRFTQVLRSLPHWAAAVPGWASGLRAGLQLPASPPRGVAVTVCGLGDTAGTWSRLHQALLDDGLAVAPMVWNPVGASMDALAERVTATARQAMAEAGTDRLHLVGHSIGGVIARWAVQRGGLHGAAETVTTLASPHRSAPLARLARRWMPLAAELEHAGRTTDAAERDAAGARWTAVVVHNDWVVPAGRQSLVALPGATNIHIAGTDHVGVLDHDRTLATVLAATAPLPAAAAA